MNKLFMLVFILLFAASCTAGKYTTYSFEPDKFHTLRLEEDDKATSNFRTGRSNQKTDVAPPFFYGAIEKVLISAPEKVTINTFELNSLVWEHAKVPVCIRYRLGEHRYPNITEHYVFLKEIDTDNTISVPVDLDRYDGVQKTVRSIPQKDTLAGGTLVYNIIYFTDLLKYSTEYEVWVKIAGLESNHVRIKIDLKENGRLVTRGEVSR